MRGLILCVLAMVAAVSGQAPAPPARHGAAPAMLAAEQQEIQALANDIARMRTLLQQMEMNLAFVQNTQSPLKHQFELEMDMWRLTLDGMERRLQRLRGTSTGGVVSPATVPLRQDSRQGRP